jgi:hypothetical protein
LVVVKDDVSRLVAEKGAIAPESLSDGGIGKRQGLGASA